MGVERQRTGLKLGSGSEPALELPWWKRGKRYTFSRYFRIAQVGSSVSGITSLYIGPYDFRNAENADRIAESSHKKGIYRLKRNVTEFVKVWKN